MLQLKLLKRIAVGVSLALVAIGFLVLLGYGHTWVVAIPICILSTVSIYEIQNVSGCKNKVLTACNMIFAGLFPFYIAFSEQIEGATFAGFGKVLIGAYVLAMLILMLKMYDVTKFENVAMGLFASIALPYALSTLILLFNLLDGYPEYFSKSMAVYIALIAMFCAWLCDTFAFFIGRSFGKHKMAPKISPKKSIEGAIAGIVGTTLSSLIAWIICNQFYFHFDTIKWWMVLVFTPFCCVISMCGDLSASVIKRNFGVKDFGTLFPEHGGMMDRIDSFIFTMSFTYLAVKTIVSFAI